MGQRRRTTTALAASVALALVASSCQGWEQTGYGPGRGSYNPAETTLTADTVGDLTFLWSGPAATIFDTSDVVASGDRVVLRSGQRIYGLDARTGEVVWEHGDASDVPPFLRGGVVHTPLLQVWPSCDRAVVAAWDLETGERRPEADIDAWPTSAPMCGGPNGAPAVGNSFLVLPSSERTGTGFPYAAGARVYDWATGTVSPAGRGSVLDERTGMLLGTDDRTVWAHPLPGVATPAWQRQDFLSAWLAPLVADDGRVYGRESGGSGWPYYLRVLDTATGADLWNGALDIAGGSFSKPAVRDGVAYTGVVTGPRSGELVVFADCGAPDCPPAWTGGYGTVGNSGGSVGPTVAGDLVYHAIAQLDDDASAWTGWLEVFPADGCGAAHCDPLVRLPLDAGPQEVLVSHGRVIVRTQGGLRVFGLP